MKKIKTIHHLFSLMLLITLATGCKEYLKYIITTRILPDGSIERTMLVEGGDSTLVKGDPSSVLAGSLPVPADSTWEIVTGLEERSINDSTNDTIYYYRARKMFCNSDELNKEINWDSAGDNHVSRNIKVEKRFRWFHTFYRYTETYKQIFPFTRKSVNDYLTDEELELIHADDDEIYYSAESDRLMLKKDTLVRHALSKADSNRMAEIKEALEKKYFEWMNINFFEEYFDMLKKALEKIGIMKLPEAEKTRDSLFAFFTDNANDEPLWFSDSCDFPLLLASRFYQVDTATLYQANHSGFDSINKKLGIGWWDIGDTYTNLAIMPGVIISTNSTTINGNTVSWYIESDDFYEKDYTLMVESKKVNKGPVIVSGAFVVLLLIGLLVGMVRKK
ncbi:MAG: hypothetical protein JW973_01410 [Bacteroidales bacterium]|nr:hypothetical protein [Bacteroidales bacterium]